MKKLISTLFTAFLFAGLVLFNFGKSKSSDKIEKSAPLSIEETNVLAQSSQIQLYGPWTITLCNFMFPPQPEILCMGTNWNLCDQYQCGEFY